MKFPALFSPVQIGTVTVPNRFVMPPMGNNLANTDGTLSDRSVAYYEARAKGGFGLITIESTVVYQEAKGGPRKPCLFSDDTVDSFRRAADACHAYGAKVSIQLQHAGPEGNSALTGYPLKAASAMPAANGREIPEAVSNEEIYRIIECYGDAARRAQQAGIDMVEVHCAHGYLVSTFISQRTNHRTDEFGGCFENRMRLPRLIIENIRRKTGGNLPILCRINACDEVEGGQSVQDAAAVAAYLEQECGVDALHVTRAVHLHDEFMWAPGITHGGFNADLVTEIKRAVSVPVIAVGRFTEPQYAELLVKQGRADLIAFGRQSIADPRAAQQGSHRPPGGAVSLHRLPAGLCAQYVCRPSHHLRREPLCGPGAGAGARCRLQEGGRGGRRPRRPVCGLGLRGAGPQGDPAGEGERAGRQLPRGLLSHRQGPAV